MDSRYYRERRKALRSEMAERQAQIEAIEALAARYGDLGEFAEPVKSLLAFLRDELADLERRLHKVSTRTCMPHAYEIDTVKDGRRFAVWYTTEADWKGSYWLSVEFRQSVPDSPFPKCARFHLEFTKRSAAKSMAKTIALRYHMIGYDALLAEFEASYQSAKE